MEARARHLADDPHEDLLVGLYADDELIAAQARLGGRWLVVSNEVGLGLVPPYPLGRLYRDALGRANQILAAAAARVLFTAERIQLVVMSLGPGEDIGLETHDDVDQFIRVEAGRVRVADAQGKPPTIPFWIAEAPARTDEPSAAVSRLRELFATDASAEAAVRMLEDELGLPAEAVRQLADYLVAARKALTVMPTQDRLVAERFFDEAGGMHVVFHAPFGSRLTRALGLALRKRFCRSFNVELQAAATDNALVLSLGPMHSFPLETIFRFLHSNTARDVLVQAMLDAPLFQTRWRWNATRALAVLRFRGGKKVPPRFQRMDADDLLALCFPDQVACLENIAGDREIPDHPLVRQTIDDALTEAMDVDGLLRLLRRIEAGEVECVARDLTEPSPLSQEILTARPYAFLDDAPLEERRTQAVMMRRFLDPATASDLGALDPAAIAHVVAEARPDPRSPDELHDALLIHGGFPAGELSPYRALFEALRRDGRAAELVTPSGTLWIPAERSHEWLALHPAARLLPEVTRPRRAGEADERPPRETALRELARGRLEAIGPITADELARATPRLVTGARSMCRALETARENLRRTASGLSRP